MTQHISDAAPSRVAPANGVDEALVDAASNVVRILPSGMKVLRLTHCGRCGLGLGFDERCRDCSPDPALYIGNPKNTFRVRQ